MHRYSIPRILLLLLCTLSFSLQAQEASALFKEAEALEKKFKDEEALDKYKAVIRQEPKNIRALCKISELYNIIGKRIPEKDKQHEYYKKGVEYARAALKVNANYAEANFAMAISMGRMALIASGEEKIKAVKEIKRYADRCIQIDPTNYKGYHVLGKWHYEVSDLSSLERWLVKVSYGALPASSIDESIKFYEKSKSLSPGFLLNYLELAKAYQRKKDKKKARRLLEELEKLPPSSADDPKIKSMGRKLLNEL